MNRKFIVTALLFCVPPLHAQMPTPQEMAEMMKQMQQMRQELDKLPPQQRQLMDQAMRQMPQGPAPGADDDEIVAPKADAERNAELAKSILTGTQLKDHVSGLQPRITRALSRSSLERAQSIEITLNKERDALPKLRSAANGLAAAGAWPEAVYLMGKVALASGDVQDLNNLAAFLTMQGVPDAAVPILLTLNARHPNNSTLLNNLGLAWFELGDTQEAERVLTLAVSRTPTHPQANVTKSRIEEARGDRKAAQASMRAAVQGGFSEEKAQRLSKLGGKMQRDDIHWNLPVPQDALGLSHFVPPPYPASFAQLPVLIPVWQTFKADIRAEQEQLSAQSKKLGEKRAAAAQAWLDEANFRGPLSAKADRMIRLDKAVLEIESARVSEHWQEAQRIEQDARDKMHQRLEEIRIAGEKQYANVAGGYGYEYSCPEITATIDTYLQTANPVLEKAGNEMLELERRRINELVYLEQFRMTDQSYEIVKLNNKSVFLGSLQQAHVHSSAQLGGLYQALLLYGGCLHASGKPKSSKLADFDDIHCQHIVDFTVPGIGSTQVRCNKMVTTLNPVGLGGKASWTEDLNQDRVLSASAEISLKGVTVGAHGEFDSEGISRGGVSVGTGIGDQVGAGPLEMGVSAGGSIGVELDRSGITDVRIEGSVGASGGSKIEGVGGAEANTRIDSTWSWNAGANASASGGFDRSLF